ncbi:MAG: hypothetical protein DRP52_01090 [Planctomycetota bacterium]|nr:MAG: hypothetical protein DRP52_01090 [Planctomycetota bacterium]RLC74469.1 MAG: hypothetical protein DRJ03_31900 [Chloroflexota bacterium]
MKPLLSVIAFNREKETEITIRSLYQTGAMDEAEVWVVDNNSSDGTADMLMGLVAEGIIKDRQTTLMMQNMGCPKALNWVLAKRRPGQHFIKVDNDVRFLTPGWVGKMTKFLADYPTAAMVSPWYSELEDSNQGRLIARHGTWDRYWPVVGHCCIHSGELLDQVGFFDVLVFDHLYGFEDLLMCHRAGYLGYICAVMREVKCEMIQRHNSLDVGRKAGQTEGRREHIDRLRPLYEKRIGQVKRGNYYTDSEGKTT